MACCKLSFNLFRFGITSPYSLILSAGSPVRRFPAISSLLRRFVADLDNLPCGRHSAFPPALIIVITPDSSDHDTLHNRFHQVFDIIRLHFLIYTCKKHLALILPIPCKALYFYGRITKPMKYQGGTVQCITLWPGPLKP